MADGNGHSTDGLALPREMVKFKIGGEDIDVPSMRFQDMAAMKDSLRAMTPELFWVDYADHVLRVVAHQLQASRPELTLEALRARCAGGEALALIGQMNELLWASGFTRPELEAAPANPGTGTLTGFAPASPPAASVEGIPSS